MSDWLVVAAIGVGTYITRLSFVALFGRSGVPGWLAAPIRYIAPAVLAALVAPEVIAPEGALDVTSANPRFFAGAVAALVAVRTKSVAWTFVAGMGALWLLQAAL